MNSIRTIDCDYLHPQFAASFLMIEGEQALFVENNTAHSVPKLLEALRSAGRRPEDVRYVIITHVHLDHAGGSYALMKACPQAVLLAHPRAATHIIDPSKLVASARKVYGDQRFEELYGEIGPVPAERVRSMQDGEEIEFGTRRLKFIHTRGHANHHLVVYDSGSQSVFTGDSFGLAYPQLGGLIFPSTSPTDFDPAEARLSLDKILGTGARLAYLTHFGVVEDLTGAATQLRGHLDFAEDLLRRATASGLEGAELQKFCLEPTRERFKRELSARGIDRPESWKILDLDIELNAQGVAFVAQKRRQKP